MRKDKSFQSDEIVKKIFFIAFILTLNLQNVFAGSNNSPDSTYLKRSLSVNISQLLFRDIRVSYEWPWKNKRLLSAGIGYKFGIHGNQFSFEKWMNEYMYLYPVEIREQEWFYITFGNSWYTNRAFLNLFVEYISIDFLFRYAYHDPVYYIYQVTKEEASYISLKSLDRVAAGINCTTGKKYFMKISDKYTSFIEIYAGCGIRYHYKEWITYGRIDGYAEIEDLVLYDTPVKKVSNIFMPTVHFGIHFGLAFGE